MGIFIAVMAAISAGLQYHSTTQQARMKRKQAEYNNQVANNEAVMLQREADATARANGRKIRNIKLRGRRLRASQEAGFAGAGVTMQGTPLEILADTTLQQNKDILNIKRANDMFQNNAKYKRMNLLSNANYMLTQAKNSEKIANIGATGQLGLDLVNAGGTGAKNGVFGKSNKKKFKNWSNL